MSNANNAPAAPAKFGAFKGVFLPSLLTILGAIMYLRFGWVVGHAGLFGTLAIVLLAHLVSYTTGLSICSIATNRTVKAGGVYYMISRSLGLPIGAALGITLFFAMSFSISLYVLGFTESFLSVLGVYEPTIFQIRLVGTITCTLLTALTFISTDLALKVQFVVLAAIILSLLSLFTGHSDTPPASGMSHLWFQRDSASFETVFAVFFPAVTGFTAGVAMSGDLKDPRRAIPRGTIAAITAGLAIYIAISIFFAHTVDAEVLRSDYMVWTRVARFAPLVIAGIFAATLSSAIGSLLGAPRYLQALAQDGVVPRFLGKGYGPSNEPRIGIIAAFIVAQCGIMVGELDFIARIVTMFFLTSYGFLCLASGIQTWSGISSFRPDFRTPAWISFSGAAICAALMFKLDTVAMISASIIVFAIFFAIKRKEMVSDYSSVWGGFWSTVVHKGVLLLHQSPVSAQSWRPHVLIFAGEPHQWENSIRFTRSLMEGRGLATCIRIVEGNLLERHAEVAQLDRETQESLRTLFPDMLARVVVEENVYDGMRNAAQLYGIPGMTPNTLLLGWGHHTSDKAAFTALIRDLLVLDHNLLLLSHDWQRDFGERSTIDIWWGGTDRNGPLMLLIAYYLKTSEAWFRANIRVHVIVSSDAAQQRRDRLDHMLASARVNATAHMVVKQPDQSIPDTIAQTSANADLTILGLAPPGDGEGEDFVHRVNGVIGRLGTVLLVRAAAQCDGEEVLFDK